jgi:hypothetical protein
MRKQLLFSFCFLLLSGIAFSQAKQKTPVKPTVSALKKLLSGTGLPYKIANDSLALVPYEGENIASYNVLVQKVGDLYIVYTNLTEALPGKIDDTKFKYLLQRNNDFDIVKTGLDSGDNTVYVRADVFTTGITTALLTRVIKQVANVTNIIAGDLK